ncbi:MAG TPA: tetratricopeptide repeat protein, partial [Gemmatimonadales bacterium]|nr:tetratricopeptide repeat protein [Gemmatimonadales bacterium]
MDWVVMTALAKDPARRYQSAHAMASDLERLLRHEPVSAAPPGMGYRMAKLFRRHRTAAIAIAAMLLAVVGGGIAAMIGFVQADRARDIAVVEAAKAEAVSRYMTDLIASAEPDRALGNVVTVRAVLDSAAARLDREPPFPEYPDVEATIRFAIGNSYRELGEYDEAIAVLLPALEIWRRELPATDIRLTDVLHRIGNSYWRLGKYEDALRYAEESLELHRVARGRMSSEYAEAVNFLGNAQADLGHFTVAESLYHTSIGIYDTVLAGKGKLPMATAINNLGTILVDLERYDDAAKQFHKALEIRYQYLDPDTPTIGATLGNLGDAILRAGRVNNAIDTLEMAVAHLERVYGPDHMVTANSWRQLANGYLEAGRLQDARAMLDRAERTYLERTGPTSHHVGRVLVRRGQITFAEGKRAAGLAEMRRGYGYIEQSLGAEHPSARWAAGLIADRYDELKDSAAQAQWRSRATP